MDSSLPTSESPARQKAETLIRLLPSSDPMSSADLAQLLRANSDLCQSLRHEGAQIEESLCGLAGRVLELIDRNGHINGRQALRLVLDLLEQVLTALGGPASAAGLADWEQDIPGLSPDPGPTQGLGLRLMDQRRLGEILVSLSMLTPEQVEQALKHQKSSNRRFGETLIELGYLNRNAVESALRFQRRRLDGGKIQPWMQGP
jgi:hypothetical protein